LSWGRAPRVVDFRHVGRGPKGAKDVKKGGRGPDVTNWLFSSPGGGPTGGGSWTEGYGGKGEQSGNMGSRGGRQKKELFSSHMQKGCWLDRIGRFGARGTIGERQTKGVVLGTLTLSVKKRDETTVSKLVEKN